MQPPFLPLQISIIEFIQSIRNPYIDLFFKFLNYFDTDIFVFILVPIIWTLFGKKWGFRVIIMLFISGLVNFYLKEIFKEPRPFTLSTSLGIIFRSGYAFPSGAAQTTTLLSGFLLYYWRSRYAILISALYIFFIGLSRVYLGVHYPLDVIVGWVVGIILFWTYLKIYLPLERYFTGKPIFWPMILRVIMGFIIIGFSPHHIPEKIAWLIIGLSLGCWTTEHYKWDYAPPKTIAMAILRCLVTVVCVFVIFYTLLYTRPFHHRILNEAYIFGLTGYWTGFGLTFINRLMDRA